MIVKECNCGPEGSHMKLVFEKHVKAVCSVQHGSHMSFRLPKTGFHICKVVLTCLQTDHVNSDEDRYNLDFSFTFPYCFQRVVVVITHRISISIKEILGF